MTWITVLGETCPFTWLRGDFAVSLECGYFCARRMDSPLPTFSRIMMC